MNDEELLAILRRMPIRSGEIRNHIWFLENANASMAVNLIDIFNYGYMMGKHDERTKRKAHRSA